MQVLVNLECSLLGDVARDECKKYVHRSTGEPKFPLDYVMIRHVRQNWS